ncbi:MAG: family 43 glycosylhydrolase [Butyrivibrio sp.]
MANPYIPSWEHIPDGEPRVFGDRVYVYGSHDRTDSDRFCDYVLKVWSASVNDLNNWICHGVAFSTRTVKGHKADADWSDLELYAPDVVEKDGKYYLYAYILDSKGCVAVSDRPEGPFKLISQYKYNIEKHYDNGTFIDPGVLVDDDGRVYIYCGYQGSYMAEINPDNMYEIIDGTYKENIIPVEKPHAFFEACSPRKIGDTYYLIYSPQIGSRLAYATSKSPTGPFIYRGIIIDNAIDYPGGNNHGSICCINGQWYIFYHRMTNGSIMSRIGCAEKIDILPDGTIPMVEMTSSGMADSLNPYEITKADTACVLTGGAIITQKNVFDRVITGITDKTVMGWKYFDFGHNSKSAMTLSLKIRGMGCKGTIHVMLDDMCGKEIGTIAFGESDGVIETVVNNITGRHSIFFKVEAGYTGWAAGMFENRYLFELEEFVFTI